MPRIDVSFISLKLIFPALYGLLRQGGEIACLIKPQFEAGREKVGKKGVVRDPAVHLEVLEHFLTPCQGESLYSAWNHLFSHPWTGGEHRISGLSEKVR